jgi:hypothetical protein
LKVKNFAEFQTDLPDDQVEEDGDVVVYAGKGVCEALGEILQRLGCTASEPVELGFPGWDMNIDYSRRPFWGRVCYLSDTQILFCIIDDSASFDRERFHPSYLDLLTRFNTELQNDARFHNVRWFKGDHVGLPVIGVLEPVSE